MTITAEQNEENIARGWSALPAAYRIPDVAPTLDQARDYCRHLAETHYENFHVATWFLPSASPAAFPLHLRLLPHLRRSRRRSPRQIRGSGASRPCGAGNWTLAMKAARAIRFLSRSPKPFAPARFPKSRSPICSLPFARTRPSHVTPPWTTCSATATTRRIPLAASCSTRAAK